MAKEHFPNEKVCHCVHMVCDWLGMQIAGIGDGAEDYYNEQVAKGKIQLPEWADELVQAIFSRVRMHV